MIMNSISKIFDLYAPVIYNYVFRLCRDPVVADQMVGDIFTRLAEHMLTSQGPIINLRTYLYEIAYHVVVDKTRQAHRAVPTKAVDSLFDVKYFGSVKTEERPTLQIAARVILNDLTHDQRDVVILRFMEGFSLKETAAIIGKKVNNVKVIQNRAVATLRKLLDCPTDEINVALKSFNHLKILNAAYPQDLLAARRASPFVYPHEGIGQDLRLEYH